MMKVIDLLNKIANGEEVPKEIEVGLHHFIYENNGEYYNVDDPCDLLFDFDNDYQLETCLNQTVYPITYDEEKKIPEKLKWNEKSQHNIVTDNTKKTLEHLLSRSEQLKKSINDIIDYLKGKGE